MDAAGSGSEGEEAATAAADYGKRKAGRLEERLGEGQHELMQGMGMGMEQDEGQEGEGGGRMVDVSLEEAEEERRQMMLMMTARQEMEDEAGEGIGTAMPERGAEEEEPVELTEEDMADVLVEAVQAVRRAREQGMAAGGRGMSPGSPDEESEEASQGACERICLPAPHFAPTALATYHTHSHSHTPHFYIMLHT